MKLNINLYIYVQLGDSEKDFLVTGNNHEMERRLDNPVSDILSHLHSMALLTRHLKLSDHDDTQIFTFVGTKSVTRDLSRDITSKDFRQENFVLNFYLKQDTVFRALTVSL